MRAGGTDADRHPSPLDRALRVVGDVRAGEGELALVLAGTVFVLLGAYYLLKVAREELVLSAYPAETKAYLAAVQAAILVPIVEGYGWLSTRITRTRLVTFGCSSHRDARERVFFSGVGVMSTMFAST